MNEMGWDDSGKMKCGKNEREKYFFSPIESLVPNITSEVYFVAQLLTTRAPAAEQTEKESGKKTCEVIYSMLQSK